jgi:hypothetical protein
VASTSDCLLCVFKRDTEKHWNSFYPGIETAHDKDFRNTVKKMPEPSQWDPLNVWTMADCNEFMELVVNQAFPFYAEKAFGRQGIVGQQLEYW